MDLLDHLLEKMSTSLSKVMIKKNVVVIKSYFAKLDIFVFVVRIRKKEGPVISG